MMRSIDEVDAERTRARKEAARHVRDLGVQYDKLAEQVNDVVRQLGQAVTSARKVFELEELAAHTKRSQAELTAWAEGNGGKAGRRTKPSNRAAKSPVEGRRTASQSSGQPAPLPSPGS
jgi:hypothetical protein